MAKLYIISGPSGSGKDTLIDTLMDQDAKILRGRKITTRKPRLRERKTGAYLFLTNKRFHEKLSTGELFFPYVKNENWYAVDKKFILDEIISGYDIFLVYSEYENVSSLKENFSKEGVQTRSILLIANMSDLKSRLNGRYEHSPEELPIRMETMKNDLSALIANRYHRSQFDYVLQNLNHPQGIQCLAEEIKSILNRERVLTEQNKNNLDIILG